MSTWAAGSADTQPLLRRITLLLSEQFGVFFATVQIGTECLESEDAEVFEATSSVQESDYGPEQSYTGGSLEQPVPHQHG